MPVTTDHILSADNIKLLLVAPPGTGKTVSEASWWEVTASPEERRQFKWLNLPEGEGYQPGDLFIYDFDFRTKPLAAMLPGIPIEYESYASSEFGLFRNHYKALAEAVYTGDFGAFKARGYLFPTRLPRTICLDSLTFLADGLMQLLLEQRGNRKDAKSDDFKGEPRRLAGIDIPVLPEWMGESMGMAQIIDIGRKLPCNFIMTAHNTQSLDMQGGQMKRKQVITIGSKVAQKIPAFFDEVYTLVNKGDVNGGDLQYWVQTKPTGDDLGKSCLRLPPEFEISYPRTLYREVMRLAGTGPIRLPGGEYFVSEAESVPPADGSASITSET